MSRIYNPVAMCLLVLLSSALPLAAQGDQAGEMYSFRSGNGATEEAKSQKSENEIAHYFRHHRPLPAAYSGYVIELTQSELPLRRDVPLFHHFGEVFYDTLRNGAYAYCIKVNFASKDAIHKFLWEVVLPKAPEAKVVKYKKGIRKTS